jgi:hypothetical protein
VKGSCSQLAAKKHVLEKIRVPKWCGLHELGEPILREQAIMTLPGDMRSLHDIILQLEKNLLMGI